MEIWTFQMQKTRLFANGGQGNMKKGCLTVGGCPHPTFYCKTELFHKYGLYSLEYGTSADYELMLRFMHKNCINAFYIQKVLINMKLGGASNGSLTSRAKGLFFDLNATRNNGVRFPLITLLCKPFRKIVQYFS
jgi:hypothetical protein